MTLEQPPVAAFVHSTRGRGLRATRIIEPGEVVFREEPTAIVLGANDVVNPAALHKQDSPIYGMPILNVHEARTVFVIKRSLSPGYAGIPNELFDYDNSTMVFGDAKKVLTEVVTELKAA